MNEPHGNSNVDLDVVKHFGNEWHSFDNEERPQEDLRREFDGYFSIFRGTNFRKMRLDLMPDVVAGVGRNLYYKTKRSVC